MSAPAVVETAPANRDSVAAAVANLKANLATPTPVAEIVPGVDPNAPPVEEVPVDPDAPVVEEAPEPEYTKVTLPGRRPGDPDLEFETNDPTIVERINMQNNAYERKAESMARMEQARQMQQEAQAFRASLSIDPIGVVTESLDEESQGLLLMRQLTNPGLWAKLGPTIIDMLSDETGRSMELMRARLEVEAMGLKERRSAEIAEQQQVDQNTRAIALSVDAIIPPHLSTEQRRLWRQDAINDLIQYASRTNTNFIHPQDIPHLLAGRLRAQGIAPEHASVAIQQAFTRNRPRPSGSPAATSAPTGEKFVQVAKARLAASAAAPTGAGAPTAAAPTIPKNAGTKDAFNAYRRARGIPEK